MLGRMCGRVCLCDWSSIFAAQGIGDVYLMSLIFALVPVWWVLVICCLCCIAFSRQALSLFPFPLESDPQVPHHLLLSKVREGENMGLCVCVFVCWRWERQGEGWEVKEKQKKGVEGDERKCPGVQQREKVTILQGPKQANDSGQFSQIWTVKYLMVLGVFI